MKIRLLHDGGYEGLANVQFPVEVEVECEGYGGGVYVGWDAISAIPGWFYNKDDAYEGGSYYFYEREVEVVANTSDLLQENGDEVEKRIAALRETGVNLFPNLSKEEKRDVLYVENEPAVSAKYYTDKILGADRKDKLISLVKDYGGAINDGCYESEYGSIQSMLACHEEEKRLLKEIIKMIEEGV